MLDVSGTDALLALAAGTVAAKGTVVWHTALSMAAGQVVLRP